MYVLLACTAPASVTIAISPSVGWDAKSSRCDFGVGENGNIFENGTRQRNQRTEALQQSRSPWGELARRAAGRNYGYGPFNSCLL
jgi:hypothetical protein